MQVVYAREPFPDRWTKSVFLAGPTPRDAETPSWRPEALRLLKAAGFDGVVFVPEDRDITGCAINPENYEPQIQWEDEGLQRADAIVFWVARELEPDEDGRLKMPAFTTNIEWGEWFDSGKVALGYPEKTPKMGYLRTKAKWNLVPIAHTLEATVGEALGIVGEGALREGGATYVPIEIWNTEAFRRWHAAQTAAGNELLKARVLWTYRIGRDRERLFFWALETDMRVGAEGRVVKDGVIIGRPDISVTILLGPDRGFNTEVVLIKEFRPSAATSDGYVHEGAGGSSWDEIGPAELAVAELLEEAGVRLKTTDLRDLGERQLLPSLCSHRAHVYVGRITDKSDLEAIRARAGKPFGREREGERTYVEFHTFRSLFEASTREGRDVDWSTLGMVFMGFYRHG